jgi:membrane protease YdiL (CAAX protease family)
VTDPQPLEPRPEPYPFWDWLDVAVMFALALPLIVLMLVGGGGAPHPPKPISRNGAAIAVALTFSFYGVWFLALRTLFRLRYGRPFWRSLAWAWPPRGFWHSAACGVLLAMASLLLGMALRIPETKTPLEELLKDRASILLIGVFGVTLGPLCEELIFRGFLMPLLARSFGALAGVLLAAVPFALLHGQEYAWGWQQLAIIFLAGAAFGWMRHRSGSTAAAAVMHGAYNLVFFVMLAALKTGGAL